MKLFGFLKSWGKNDEASAEDRPAPKPAAASRTPAPSTAPPPRKDKASKASAPQASTAKPAKGSSARAETPRSGPSPPPRQAARVEPGAVVPPAPDVGETDLAALDDIFGKGASSAVTTVRGSSQDVDKASIRELFVQIIGQQTTPVKNLVFELKRGTASKEYLEICRPVVATLVEAAESLGLGEESLSMKQLGEALSLAGEGDGKTIEPAARDLLLEGYEAMVRDLPEAFALCEDTTKRDEIVIHALLKQVPDVGRVTFDRLYGAGLTTLESLFHAKPAELASTTGVPMWLCDRICRKLVEYRAEAERVGRGDQAVHHKRLAQLLAELKRENDKYERAAEDEWTDPDLAAAKRAARQNRQVCALKIEVVLAELGEIDLVEQFQKLSFELRIHTLETFLAQGGSTERGVPAAAGSARGVHGSR